MNFDELIPHLTEKWNNKTLSEFRAEAERETCGTVYEAIRVQGGKRVVLLMCLTHADQIRSLESVFNFVDDGGSENWSTFTLAELFKRTVLGAGFAFECLRDKEGNRIAVVIISTEPKSMERLNILFNLPA